eukprot:CAMPEP_0176416830 /NCGR_PEP_ID=MMETSP0127-20121128/6556_1 /TAXON_ID=938130 /ORGANISM="Platyophrya macrostoma, Strain WH" /LENGTH=240 /DNA_ID=CAMNT_0017796933 /DNA_START=14 /DNA_END=736 /DNA_ORIENTATION=-
MKSFKSAATTESTKPPSRGFRTRAQMLQIIPIPTSTRDCIIIKPNEEAIGFRYDCYPEGGIPHITKDMFNNTIRGANKVIEGVWKLKKAEQSRSYGRKTRYLLYLALMMIPITVILLLVLIYGTGNEGLLWGAVALVSASILITLVSVAIAFFSTPKFMNFENTVRKRLRAYIDTQNNHNYNALKYKWRMQDEFYWLELVPEHMLDYDNENRPLMDLPSGATGIKIGGNKTTEIELLKKS